MTLTVNEANAFDVIDASYVASAPHADGLPAPALAEMAFAGRSNVGKSSLMNALMQRKNLVRTSSTPGCTRQLNLFHVKTRGSLELNLADLPGYGYAKRSKAEKGGWGPMLESYLQTRVTLRGVFILVDIRRGVEDEERDLIEFVLKGRNVDEPAPPQIFLVATKLDKLALSARKPRLLALKEEVKPLVPIGFSAVTGDGRDALWRAIRFAALGVGSSTTG